MIAQVQVSILGGHFNDDVFVFSSGKPRIHAGAGDQEIVVVIAPGFDPEIAGREDEVITATGLDQNVEYLCRTPGPLWVTTLLASLASRTTC